MHLEMLALSYLFAHLASAYSAIKDVTVEIRRIHRHHRHHHHHSSSIGSSSTQFSSHFFRFIENCNSTGYDLKDAIVVTAVLIYFMAILRQWFYAISATVSILVFSILYACFYVGFYAEKTGLCVQPYKRNVIENDWLTILSGSDVCDKL